MMIENITTPTQNLQRLVVRMLYDADFSKKILNSEQELNRLKLDLPTDSWTWLKQNHPYAYQADEFRSHRTLEALIAYLPLSFSIYLSLIKSTNILDFFHSSFFHQGIQNRELLILALHQYLIDFFEKKKILNKIKKILELEYQIAYFKTIKPQSNLDHTVSENIQLDHLTLPQNYKLIVVDQKQYDIYLAFLKNLASQKGTILEKLISSKSLVQAILNAENKSAKVYLKIMDGDLEELPVSLYKVLSLIDQKLALSQIMSLMQEMGVDQQESTALLMEWIADGLIGFSIKT